jgi:predicted phosphodiesterase
LLTWVGTAAQQPSLPAKPDSLKFAVIGDNGTGKKPQFDVAAQMVTAHRTFPFELVIMLGDNIYGGQSPKDLVDKFERPYKPLLDAGVKFYASLGNHDSVNFRFYEPWNMNGERFYTYSKRNVRFFVLDTNYLEKKQLEWLEQELKNSNEDWKIAYFHHPLYSSGRRHGSDTELQGVLEPLFVKYGIDVVFAGHDHFYERITPQKGIYHFVSGSAGQLRRGNLRESGLTITGYDQDQSFMLVEVYEDVMAFEAVSRTGRVVDSGTIERQRRPSTTAASPPPAGERPGASQLSAPTRYNEGFGDRDGRAP